MTVILNNIKSCAYIKLLKHLHPIIQPSPDFSSFSRITLTYSVNKRGDRIPPCFTPDISETSRDLTLCHLMVVEFLKNQFSKILIISLLTFLSCSRHSMPKILVLSNAFFKSIDPIFIVELRLLKNFTTLRTVCIELYIET